MKDPIDAVMQRTQRYWYVDGLAEMVVGGVILIIGLFYFLLGLAEPHTVSAWVVGLGQPLIILLGWWGASKTVKALKERITYPRTGYLTYPPKGGKTRLKTMALAIGISIGMTLLVAWLSTYLHRNWIPASAGAILSIATAYLAYRLGLVRFYALAAYIFGLGILTALLALSDTFSNAFLLAGIGLGLAVSGSLTLGNYLRHTQPASPEEPL